jgi:ribonuclease D
VDINPTRWVKNALRDKAREASIPVYVIATNKELAEITQKQPRSMEALHNIAGFGKKKCQNHGEAIIKIVKRFDEVQKNTEVTAKSLQTKTDMDMPHGDQ